MLKKETIIEFNIWLCGIANDSCAFGEMMLEENILRKIMRSLSKMFDMTVIAIKGTQDISIMKINVFFDNLLTFVMVIDGKPEVFKANTTDHQD